MLSGLKHNNQCVIFSIFVALFVIVCNDLIALDLGLALKPGFLLLISIVLYTTFLKFKEETLLVFFKMDFLVLAWLCLALIFCFYNSGVKNYAYTMSAVVFVLFVLDSKLSIIQTHKLLIFDAFVIAGILVSLFGILQFLVSIINFGDFLYVQQWWYKGVIARVNGLMYEPSYYALVVFPYIVMSFFLLDNNTLAKKQRIAIRFLYCFSIIAIILSSSRVGVIACALTLIVISFFKFIFFKNVGYKLNRDILRVVVFVLLVIGFFISVDRTSEYLKTHETNPNNYSQSVLNGIGVDSTANHSISMRLDALLNTVNLAQQHLVVGVGLGNIANEIAKEKNISSEDVSELKMYEGLVPAIEIAAATGVIGAILFLSWIFMTGIFGILKKRLTCSSDYIHIALSLAMLAQFLLMQANQNVLRMYFWTTLFMMMTFYYSTVIYNSTSRDS
ncbi:O-antigen ligase family protein [Cobetia marina]